VPSFLPGILSRESLLPVAHAINGEKIERGRVYVAPPDLHLLLEDGYIKLVRGPKENLHRPSIDALFRSAARCSRIGNNNCRGLTGFARKGTFARNVGALHEKPVVGHLQV